MSRHRAMIETEAGILRELHAEVHATYRRRSASRTGMEEWRQACERFHRYASPLDSWLRQATTAGLATRPDAREFAISYLEVDPVYFRSGYSKEAILSRLKSVALTASEARRLEAVLIDAIRRRGQREFSSYCRLAAAMKSAAVAEAAAALAESGDPHVASRARMMLRYLRSGRRSGA